MLELGSRSKQGQALTEIFTQDSYLIPFRYPLESCSSDAERECDMLSDFFMDGQKTTQRRKFVMRFVTVKLLKMTAMSKEAEPNPQQKNTTTGKNNSLTFGMNSAQSDCSFDF